jgi:hypothetical protein
MAILSPLGKPVVPSITLDSRQASFLKALSTHPFFFPAPTATYPDLSDLNTRSFCVSIHSLSHSHRTTFRLPMAT